MSDETEGDGYILARTAEEYARLRLQALVWTAMTGKVLEAAGLGPGMRCLDAGCGPGEAMRLMGRIVGPEGHVTGMDVDAALGAHMLAELHRSEGPQFSFIAADITHGKPVAGAPFDLVFARLLLLHMADPVAVVRRLAALVRPGGRLVLMDYDLSRLAVRPAAPAMERGFEIVAACFSAGGRHPDSGLRLTDYLASAGLPPPSGTDASVIFAPVRVLGPMLRGVLSGLAASAAALGIADAAEMSAVLTGIEAVEVENRHYGLGPLMIAAWTTVSPAS